MTVKGLIYIYVCFFYFLFIDVMYILGELYIKVVGGELWCPPQL